MDSQADVLEKLAASVERLERTFDSVAHTTDKVVEPYRRSAARRYPVLFVISVTLGVSATFYGFERLLAGIEIFDQHPALILLFGLGVLVVTGTLYKKLS